MAFKHDDIIDSRDLVARIAELTEDDDALEALDREELDELEILRVAVREINLYAGDSAEDGVALIADHYFRDYAEEMAEEFCSIDLAGDLPWPLRCIDWDLAAEELRMDYTAIEIDDVTYWFR